MITLNRGLTQRVERFIASHDLSEEYATMLRKRVASLVSFLELNGHPDTIIDPVLVTELVNAWLLSLRDSIASPHTIDGYRRAFLAVWNFAENPDTDHPPLRLRRIKKPLAVPEAFTHDDIKAHLHVADRLTGRHPDGNRRCDYWVGVLEAAYSTGLRRGDIIRVKFAQVGADGRATIHQHKTGFPVHVRFSPEAMTRSRRLTHTGGLMFPWPYGLNYFTLTFKAIAKAAETGGTFRMYRRSAGSYAESTQRGNGARLLGHRNESVFRAHYDDPTISRPNEVTPPPLK